MIGECPGNEELKVAAIVNWYGITDVGDLLDGPNMKTYAVTWLSSLTNRYEIAKRVSPLEYVRVGLPPILTIHGDADPTVPYSHGTRLHESTDQRRVCPISFSPSPVETHGGFTREETLKIFSDVSFEIQFGEVAGTKLASFRQSGNDESCILEKVYPDSLTVPLDISDRYLRRMACSSLPLRRDGAGMRSRRLIFPRFGNLESNAGSNSRTVQTMLALDILHVHARLVEKGPHSIWAASSRSCSERCQSSLEVSGMQNTLQDVVVCEGLVDEWRIKEKAVRYDNRPPCVLMARLARVQSRARSS